MESTPTRGLSRNDHLLANVALLYYGAGMTQSEIAKRIGVSRASVVNYLREGRERGIVDIHINGQALASSSLSRDLRLKYGLADVYIAQYGQDETALLQTSHAAAMAFLDIVKPGDHIGVAWGKTIKNIADQLPTTLLKDSSVSQIIGAMHSTRLLSAEACSIQIARRISAQCFNLHAPAVLSSPQLAQALKHEPTIKAQLERLNTLDVALFSVGDCSETTHLVAAGIASPQDVREAKALGARGVVCSRFIDASGEQVEIELNQRLISIDIATLKNIEKKILVVAGTAKLAALKAALMGKLATHLVLNETLAAALLKEGK